MTGVGERVVGGFRILKKIQGGSGAQGTVYQAVCVEDLHGFGVLDRTVALKMMPTSDDNGEQWRKLKKRTNELVKLDHPNVVKYYGCFEQHDEYEDAYVIVQEFLDGETLKARLARNPSGLDVDEGLRIVKAAVSGLEYTSVRGIIHRDVKPGNIFICSDGSVKLIDFEIAKQDGGTATASTGNIRGSFDYMAPDFTEADFHGDVMSDVFSMGIVFHEVITGHTPYGHKQEGDRQFAFFARWAKRDEGENPIRVSSRVKRLLAHADSVVVKATNPNRSERYADFSQFKEGLASVKFRDLKSGPNTYRMLRFIGKGGFGEVLKARWREQKCVVAIKHLLRSEYADRFRREAKVMKKLESPCFVRFIDFFEVGGGNGRGAFLVMNFLSGMPGSSLRDAIRHSEGDALDEKSVLIAFERYCRALAMLHAQGIYHRDIKPSNLYFPAGRPNDSAIMDFGIVRDMNATVVTHDGNVPGTLDYMPPEIVRDSSRGDSKTDIYAMGLCFYEALTGSQCYQRLPSGSAQAWTEFIRRAKDLTPPNLDNGKKPLDHELKKLIAEMTAPKASKRLADAAEIAERIREIREERYGGGDVVGSDPETSVTVATVGTATMPTGPMEGETDLSIETIATEPVEVPIVAIEGEEEPEAETADFVDVDEPKSRISFASRLLTIIGTFVFTLAIVVGAAWFIFGEKLRKIIYEPEPVKNGESTVVTNIVPPINGPTKAERRGKLVADLEECLYDTPVTNRRDRLKSAKRLLNIDAGGEKLLDSEEIENYRDKIEKGEKLQVGEIRNSYSSVITVNRTKILSGSSEVFVFDEGLPESWIANTEGRAPVKLSRDFDGKTLEVKATDFDASDEEERKKDDETKRREMSRAQLLSDLTEKMRVDPISNRKSRLAEARALLEKDRDGDKLLDDVRRQEYINGIDQNLRKLIGEVRNDSGVEVTVNGQAMAPGATKRFAFDDGRLPADWTAKAAGYDAKTLSADFDEKTIFVGKMTQGAVVMTLPKLEDGVMCFYANRPVQSSLRLRPGNYSLTYRRPGYVDQEAKFEVYFNTPMTLPVPVRWQANPVEVTVPIGLEPGVVCKVDNKNATGVLNLSPAEHVYSYEREDYEPQTGRFTVEAGKRCEVPRPKEWKRTAAYQKFVDAGKAVQSGDWIKARDLLSETGVLSAERETQRKRLEEQVNERIKDAEAEAARKRAEAEAAKKKAEEQAAIQKAKEEEEKKKAQEEEEKQRRLKYKLDSANKMFEDAQNREMYNNNPGPTYYEAAGLYYEVLVGGLKLDAEILRNMKYAIDEAEKNYVIMRDNFMKDKVMGKGGSIGRNIEDIEKKLENLKKWREEMILRGGAA